VIRREEQLNLAEAPNCSSVARPPQAEDPVLVRAVVAGVVLQHLSDVDAAQVVRDEGQQITNVSAHAARLRGFGPGENLQRLR
jgi:hypothetical protein